MKTNFIVSTFVGAICMLGAYFALTREDVPRTVRSVENDKFTHRLVTKPRKILKPSTHREEYRQDKKALHELIKHNQKVSSLIQAGKQKNEKLIAKLRRNPTALQNPEDGYFLSAEAKKEVEGKKVSFRGDTKQILAASSEQANTSISKSSTFVASADGEVIPKIKGTIPPLRGAIAYQPASGSLLFGQAYAALSCTTPSVELFDTKTMTVLEDNPIADNFLEASTTFEFDPVELDLDLKNPTRYKLRTKGCSRKFERIITSFYSFQDMTVISTLLSQVLNTSIDSQALNSAISVEISAIDGSELEKIEKAIDDTVTATASLEDVYSALESSTEATNYFSETFEGESVTVLKEAAPKVTSLSTPGIMDENISSNFQVLGEHWDSTYTVAYQWILDGSTISNSNSWDYEPPDNSAAVANVVLRVGRKNSGDADVDTSLPYHEFTYNINVNLVNDAPTLTATQTVATNEDTVLNFNLNAGFDVESDPITYSVVSTTTNGVLTCTGGGSTACSYTPNLNFFGTDSFTYKVNDGELDSNVATVTITVNPVNDNPVMVGNQTESATEDIVHSFTLSGATDVDIPAQTISYKIVTAPTNGTISNCITTGSYGTDLTCDYTPNLNFNGTDSFTYRANDSLIDSVSDAVVTINVAAVNDAPVLVTPQNGSATEDTVFNFNLGVASDVENDTITYIKLTDPADGTLSCTGGTSTACTFTPNLNFNGTTSFTYKANDGTDDSNTATYNINVAAVNDAPVMVGDQSETIAEDNTLSFTLTGATDVDIPAQTISYKIITAPTNGTISNCITTGSYGTDLACDYTPNANFYGSDSFTYRANDGVIDSVSDSTVSITVTSVNDAPVLATTQAVSTNEDTTLAFNLNAAADVESDTLTYIKLTDPASGSLTCDGGTSTACTYVPATDFNGSVSFTYKANDGVDDSNIATVTITVNAVNDPPVMAGNQTESATEDTVLSFTLSGATDVDLPAQTISYKILSNPSNGTISNCITTGSYGTDLTCDYTPNLNFNGTDSFTYIANDSVIDAVASSTVTINVAAVNDAPTLVATQSVTTNEDTPLTFTLNTGSDVENDTLTYIKVSDPADGTLTCVGGTSNSCTYTPDLNFNGSTTFTYKVNDGALDSNIATVTINVTSENDPPVMVGNQSETVNEDTTLSFTLSGATDVDLPAQTISYKVITAPSNGTLSNCITTGSYGTDITCDYLPNANFNGSDSFTYRANDSLTDSSSDATVSITINPVNDAPTVASTQTVNTNEDTAVTFDLNLGSDIENDTLTYIKVSNPANGTASCTGGTSRSCTYTPNLNFNGTDSFTFKVNDGALDSNIATVTINVAALNDPPVMVGNQTESTNEDTLVSFTLSGATDVDLPAQTLSYKLISAPTNGTLSNCIVAGSYGTDITCDYTPSLNFNGTDSFTYRANDSVTDSSTDATVTINVAAVNDAPTLSSPQAISTNEDTAITFNLVAGSDIESDPLSYIKITDTTNGTITCVGGANRSCTYTPNANYNGSDSFTYKVNDGALDSTVATVNITVNPINDPPVMAGNQTENGTEDTVLSFTLSGATDVDIPAQTISYKIVTAPSNGTISNCITTGSYGTDLTCDYTPSANFNGTDSFTYLANDSVTDSVTNSTVTINIAAVNDAPIAYNKSISTNEDTAITFNLNTGSDVDADTLSYIKVTNTTNGTITCVGGANRSCTYTPNANYNGADSFTYKVNDGALDSNIATVSITVNSINDPPVMAANQSFSIDDNSALSITLSNATDVDGDSLTYKIVTAPSNGTLSNCITTGSYGTDLTCTYTSNVNFHGTETFTFIANDGSVDAGSVETVTITVTDDTPSAPPTIALTSPVYTKVTSNTFTVSSCSDISFVLINEGTQPAAGDAAWQACSTTANAITYTLASATQGTHTLKAWSKDPHGNVSTTSNNNNIVYDTVVPVIAVTDPVIVKGGATTSLSWTLTEVNSSAAQNFTVDYYNGSSWSTIGTTAALNGPLSTQAFSKSWSVPSVNITTAKFRVTYADLAGNSTTVTSPSFEIDSIAPSLAYVSPAHNSYHLSSVTVTVSCEAGLDVNFSGDMPAGFATTCPGGGSFSQLVNFSSGDGPKVITINQVDAAGNSTSVNRTFIRDEVAPVMARTTGVSPDFTKNDQPNAWGGTCEGNYTIYVTGDETTSFNCSSGTWSWTPSAKTVDGTYTYNLVQTDAAGNTSSPPLSVSWERDATPPVFDATSPIAIASGGSGSETKLVDSVTLSGTCEGTNSIAISNAATDTISCSASTWTWTSPTFTTDATRTFVFTQSDSAGNTAALTYNWTRDSNFPALIIAEGTVKNNVDTVTFSGSCEDGLTINITGSQTTTTTCSSGAWSWTSATNTTDATRTYSFAQTNGSSNTTTVGGTWIRETNPPTISAFSTSAADPSTSAFIPTDVQATTQNASVYVKSVCMKSDDNTKPAVDAECWIDVDSPSIGQALAQTLTLDEFSYLLGWTPKTYSVYVWVKDEASNISDLTNTGAGTSGVDTFSLSYDPGIPPEVFDVFAANTDLAPIPPTRAQSSSPAGTDLYIVWKATDNATLPSGAISLYYSPDEINFTTIVTGLDNANYGCPNITLAADQGCYKWTGGSPLNTSYKIRVKVTDVGGISVQTISNPINADTIKIIAGNTESGLGGSAQTALFFTRKNGAEADPGTLVVTDDGRFYVADYKRGILTIDPNDGKQKVFIPQTGTSSGDGGPAASATLNYAIKIALDFQGRMLIMDRNRIRRVDLNQENPTIETIIGGGSDTSDTVANPLDVQIYNHSKNSWTARTIPFFATPNGDIYFMSDYGVKNWNVPTYRFRIYKAATGQVVSQYLGGTGDSVYPTQDLSLCQMQHIGLRYDPATSNITGVTATPRHYSNWNGGTQCDTDGDPLTTEWHDRYTIAYFDPATFQAIPAYDDWGRYYRYFNVTGMDGNVYRFIDQSYVDRINFDGTHTRVFGSGRGYCADGTAATSCLGDISDIFVTKTGKIYMLEGGQIRTVDESGNVVTLFGQRRSYGDGVNALNARFDSVGFVKKLDNGEYIVSDPQSYRIKQFAVEGNINLIAGNGNYDSYYNTGVDAKTVGMYDGNWLAVDKSNGNVYSRSYAYGRVAMLNRSTGFWENIIGFGSNRYDANDGQTGYNQRNSSDDRILVLGFDGTNLLTSHMNYNNDNKNWEHYMWKLFDSTNSYMQSHLAGTNGAETYTGGTEGICASGSTAATCKMPHYSFAGLPYWDAPNNRWIFIRRYNEGSSTDRQIWALNVGGTLDHIATSSRRAYRYTYVKEGATEYLYYCEGGRIYKHNISTDTDGGALTWPITNLSCVGHSLEYNSTNNSLIFPFEQNGLYGVGEYFLP